MSRLAGSAWACGADGCTHVCLYMMNACRAHRTTGPNPLQLLARLHWRRRPRRLVRRSCLCAAAAEVEHGVHHPVIGGGVVRQGAQQVTQLLIAHCRAHAKAGAVRALQGLGLDKGSLGPSGSILHEQGLPTAVGRPKSTHPLTSGGEQV